MALRLATRGSALALAQAGTVAESLGGAEIVEASSDGEPGDKSSFVREVERALLEGRPTSASTPPRTCPAELPDGLALAGVPAREQPADAWIGDADSLGDVPEGARVGTASLRRRAQLLAARPDLEVVELRGNVDTRLRRLADGELDAIVLAAAGLRRLGRARRSPSARHRGDDPGARPGNPGPGGADRRRGGAASAAARSATRALMRADRRARRRSRRWTRAATPRSGSTPAATATGIAIDGFAGLPDGSEWVRDEVEGPPPSRRWRRGWRSGCRRRRARAAAPGERQVSR